MRKFFALFFAVFGFFIFFASSVAVAIAPSLPKVMMAVVGGVILVIAYKSDERRANSEEERRKQNSLRRTELLASSGWSNGRTLEIKTSGLSIVYVSLAALATIFAFYSSIFDSIVNLPVSIALALLSIVLVFCILRILPRIINPALSIGADGIATPVYGYIAWLNVGGIYLHRQMYRGQVVNHWLYFKLDHCEEEGLHWTERVLSSMGMGVKRRKIIAISLHGANEEPETIVALTQILWERKVGVTQYWSPFVPEAYNQAMTRIQAARSHLEKSGLLYGDAKIAENCLLQSDQLQKDFDFIEKYNRRNSYRINALVAASIVVSIVVAVLSKLHR